MSGVYKRQEARGKRQEARGKRQEARGGQDANLVFRSGVEYKGQVTEERKEEEDKKRTRSHP